MSAKEKIVFPLDVATEDEALKFVNLLKDSVGVFKIGLELFISCGPSIVKKVQDISPETKIFLDLKLHDIPETVRKSVRAVQNLNVDFLTVHSETASLFDGFQKGKLKILGVTVLTSISEEDIKAMGYAQEFSNSKDLVLKRADILKKAGADGFITSPQEVKFLRVAYGQDTIIMTPGIRPTFGEVRGDDQKRIATPERAIKDGSDYLVIGRPIRNAKDPVLVCEKIAQEIDKAL